MTDLIIVGAGAAGLSASLFASRYGIKHLIFGMEPGGQLNNAQMIENYLGFPEITGENLKNKFVKQVESYGVGIDTRKVVGIKAKNNGFQITTEKGGAESKAILLAMGAKHRSLNVPGEEALIGHGISYSPIADAMDYRGKTVALVGGGDSACTGAIALAEYAQKVYLIVRKDSFRAEKQWLDKVLATDNIEILYKTLVTQVKGENWVENITLSNGKELAIEGLFITIGQVPAVEVVSEIGVALNNNGYIIIRPDCTTNVPGVFAAGDLTQPEGGFVFRQIITSAGQGALAVASIFQYLHQRRPEPNWS